MNRRAFLLGTSAMVAAVATAKLPATAPARTVEDLIAALQAQMEQHLINDQINLFLYGNSVIEWLNEPPFLRVVPPNEWDGLISGPHRMTQISLASAATQCLTNRSNLRSILNMNGGIEPS